ncbi:MAG: class I SAM-dependent methyltransferase [Pyrinomonadaceae bacterium]
MDSAFENMDRMYRHQRYFYDVTRRYYLLGRDQLIARFPDDKEFSVLEAGCGTGRNLALVAEKYPLAELYGLDASQEMLDSAQQKFSKKSLQDRINTKLALADEFAFDTTFGLKYPFDIIYFSFSISMIPPWKASVDNALRNLKPGGILYFVDFYDQRDLPKPISRGLKWWLRQFHVVYPRELIPYLETLENEGLGVLAFESLFRSYSFIARFEKS